MPPSTCRRSCGAFKMPTERSDVWQWTRPFGFGVILSPFCPNLSCGSSTRPRTSGVRRSRCSPTLPSSLCPWRRRLCRGSATAVALSGVPPSWRSALWALAPPHPSCLRSRVGCPTATRVCGRPQWSCLGILAGSQHHSQSRSSIACWTAIRMSPGLLRRPSLEAYAGRRGGSWGRSRGSSRRMAFGSRAASPRCCSSSDLPAGLLCSRLLRGLRTATRTGDEMRQRRWGCLREPRSVASGSCAAA
mmetsp:Transcript_93198/g.237054  ORF Transcript_93198/g.237054 Transcript_93198/m.237054 type:complete len:246 (+) Transcript_93198:148-885(+)